MADLELRWSQFSPHKKEGDRVVRPIRSEPHRLSPSSFLRAIEGGDIGKDYK